MSRSMLEQGRAAYAYEQVRDFMSSKPKTVSKEYRSYLKKMPAMVQMNGLGETLAFYYAKDETHRDIYFQVIRWLQRKYGKQLLGNNESEALHAILRMDSPDYRVMSMEVVALVNWMRRFADGFSKAGEGAKS